MMAYEPIPYELTDDGADYDSADYPVDSTYYPCCRATGGHAEGCSVAGVDVGAAIEPPAWCEPGSQPEYQMDIAGRPVAMWSRSVGADVWICCADKVVGGRVRRSAARIEFSEMPAGLERAAALAMARQLVAAAELLGGDEQ